MLFSADYRDGIVKIDKKHHAGFYAVSLLNQYYKNDTAARIAVSREYIWHIKETLALGYLNDTDFVKAGKEIQNILKILPKLKPFDTWDISAESERTANLFTKPNADLITEYFNIKAKIQNMDLAQVVLDILPPEYDKAFFDMAEDLLKSVNEALNFYDKLPEDMGKAFKKLLNFVSSIDDAERFDEAHLLPIAIKVFGTAECNVKTEYVAVNKRKDVSLAKRLYFEDFYSFIVTDFFESLHYGHYPRRCEICERYFLMTSARKQKYCNGFAPYMVRGKRTTCRKYAISINRKEREQDNPIVAIYEKRASAIRSEKSRGTITPEFANMATFIAKNNKGRALADYEYFTTQYMKDMTHKKLYEDTEKMLR